MDIIFQYENHGLILPINPENLQVTVPSPSQKLKVVGIGDIAIPQTEGLKSVNIKSFFWKYLFDKDKYKRLARALTAAVADELITSERTGAFGVFAGGAIQSASVKSDSDTFKRLSQYVEWFEVWQSRKVPARFTVISSPNEPIEHFDFDVICERFNYEIRAGEEEDYYYELELSEYRHYEAVELNVRTEIDTKSGEAQTKAEKPHKSRIDTMKQKAKEIEIKIDDSIWTLAKRYGQDKVDDWQKIYNIPFNRNIIGNNLKLEGLAGKTLQMPKEWL